MTDPTHEHCIPVEVADELAKALVLALFLPRYRDRAEAVLREYGASRGIPVGGEGAQCLT